MLFSLLKHYLDTDTALKVSQSLYCFTTSISHGVENYFPGLWGTGISDAIFQIFILFINSVQEKYTILPVSAVIPPSDNWIQHSVPHGKLL